MKLAAILKKHIAIKIRKNFKKFKITNYKILNQIAKFLKPVYLVI